MRLSELEWIVPAGLARHSPAPHNRCSVLVPTNVAHRYGATVKGGQVLRSVWALVPCLLLWASACAKGGADEPRPSDSPVRVEVTNQHALPVEIYAFGSGISQRLGTVDPGMDAHFVIPANLTRSGSVELQASPTASSQRFRSGALLLAPGTIVELNVAPRLFSSTATLRP